MPKMKFCPRCGLNKHIEEYFKDTKSSRLECKDCFYESKIQKLNHEAWRIKNSEALKFLNSLRHRKSICELDESYLRKLIYRELGIKDPDKTLIELKKHIVSLKRKTYEKQRQIKCR